MGVLIGMLIIAAVCIFIASHIIAGAMNAADEQEFGQPIEGEAESHKGSE
jgi:hypothetical protein